LFLRNHDELTLEMVAHEEREYMYETYCADVRTRINLGIRRRLAPLMGNHRGRIELLTSILLSLPGTPIIYYGDEIGMGDDISLSDRNGMRTPMQWNQAPNAGFSHADPAMLYSPVITDPVWGYKAVNVSAQQSDPSSMLHWVRKMNALRKRLPIFGRGSFEFVMPENRKILGYLRRLGNEQILCIMNLSPYEQTAQAEVPGLTGITPMDVVAQVKLPPITHQPYGFTIAPYGFYWLQLSNIRTG